MKVSGWKIFQIIQFIIFAGVSIFLFVRQVDGSGAENTTDVKLISFAVWLGFYLFLLALVSYTAPNGVSDAEYDRSVLIMYEEEE